MQQAGPAIAGPVFSVLKQIAATTCKKNAPPLPRAKQRKELPLRKSTQETAEKNAATQEKQKKTKKTPKNWKYTPQRPQRVTKVYRKPFHYPLSHTNEQNKCANKGNFQQKGY